MEIFEHVREVDGHPNISTVFITPYLLCLKLFKVEITGELSEVNNDSSEVRLFSQIMHREEMIGLY